VRVAPKPAAAAVPAGEGALPPAPPAVLAELSAGQRPQVLHAAPAVHGRQHQPRRGREAVHAARRRILQQVPHLAAVAVAVQPGARHQLWPQFGHGKLDKPDLDALGTFLQKLGAAGLLSPNRQLEDKVLEIADLPTPDDDDLAIFTDATKVTAANPADRSANLLSDEQAKVLAELGPPESFTILFYQEPGESSVDDIRFEVWRYHAAGREIAFVNGENSSDTPMDVPSDGLSPTRFSPEQFGAYMTLRDLIAQTGIRSYLRGASEPELVAGGEMYFSDRLAFAMLHGRLVAVEAMALEVEG